MCGVLASLKKTIFIDGKIKTVTPNLYDALLHI